MTLVNCLPYIHDVTYLFHGLSFFTVNMKEKKGKQVYKLHNKYQWFLRFCSSGIHDLNKILLGILKKKINVIKNIVGYSYEYGYNLLRIKVKTSQKSSIRIPALPYSL